MKCIKKNRLSLGSNEKDIECNLSEVLQYIYDHCPLDYDVTDKLYKYVEVDNDYEFDIDDYFDTSEYLTFENNPMLDNDYAYKLLRNYDENSIYGRKYENSELIKELNNYFVVGHSPKMLRLDNVVRIKLINNREVFDIIRYIKKLDWKLHFWDEYVLFDQKGITFHDLIIAAYKIKCRKFDSECEAFDKFRDFIVLKNETNEIEILADVWFYYST